MLIQWMHISDIKKNKMPNQHVNKMVPYSNN